MRPTFLLLLAACASHPNRTPVASDSAPPTRREDVRDVIQGVTVEDPYRWLEAEKTPDVQAWMKAQDEYARPRLKALPGRDAMAKRLAELLYYDSVKAPEHRGNRYFYARKLATKEKSIVYVREGAAGAERALLDPNSWTKDGSDALGGWWPTWDGSKVAYKIRHNNADESTMYVIDVGTTKNLPDTIEGAKYAGASWTPDGGGFYYTWIPQDPSIKTADRPGHQVVKFHKLGDDPAKDAVVVDKTGDATTFQNVQLSKDGHWLIRSLLHGWRSSDVWYRDARKPSQEWKPLAVGRDARFDVMPFRDRFYVLTEENAPKRHVFSVDPASGKWTEIVPERTDAQLDDASIVGGKLALLYLKDVISHVEVHDLDGKLVREVPLPAVGTSTNLLGDEDDDEAYFQFESFTFPIEIYRTSVARGGAEPYFKLKIPVDPSAYEVEQVFTASKDGTRVPLFLVHKKGAPRNPATPTLLYGYGGFLVSEAPVFSPSLYPWLEAGGVYALAILRGGGEYGEEWHRAGMLERKQNVFDDFIAAGEYLVKEKWADPAHLAIRGGSNGGLLVGAAEVQRPDLFGVVLCHVPLLDMVRYHLFGSGKTWVSEYGSVEDPKVAQAILAYSPYQRVRMGTKYPATLMLSADSDDRVDPMHARKFGAALQAATTGGPVWVRIERNAGHGGADMVKATIEERADEYAFALANMPR